MNEHKQGKILGKQGVNVSKNTPFYEGTFIKRPIFLHFWAILQIWRLDCEVVNVSVR